ncbi:MAG: hypothetical protein Kow0096_14010 [Thiohalomonadaceae bacterium]
MTELSRHAYAQVRLQSRYGQLPDAAVWQRLEGITALGHFLQTARTTGLRPWLLNIAAHGDSHAMETSLRRQLRQHIAEVARWLPPPWRPATTWCSLLPDLPALQHLRGGGEIPAWLHDDEHLKPYTHDLPALRLQALRDSPYAPLLADADDTAPGTAWAAHWRTLWPAETTAAERAALEGLATLFANHYASLRSEPGQDSRRAHDDLERRLRLGFRRHPRQAATAFYYLALCGLTLQRLRGLLTRLLLFPLEPAS